MSALGKRLTEEELAAQQEKWDFMKNKPYEYHCTGEALKDGAKKAFFEKSNLYKWTGTLGEYTIWAYNKTGQMSKAGHAWPHAYVDEESQTINAAMWFPVNDNEFKLVAAWTFSIQGDGTSVYYLTEYQTDVWALSEAADDGAKDSPITSKASAEHFSVSSGDYEVNKFDCFSLDTITASEMAAFEAAFKSQSVDAEV